jgi:beta-lactamase regulating signal transducer with metallopeptidase domain
MNAAEVWASLDAWGFAVMRGMLTLLWQSSILFAATLALGWALRKRRAAVRHTLWLSALLLTPFLLPLTWLATHGGAPQIPVAVLPTYQAQYESLPPGFPIPAGPPEETLATIDHMPAPLPTAEPESPVLSFLDYPWALLLFVYASGLPIFVAWYAAGHARIRYWIRDSTPVTSSAMLDAFGEARETLGLKQDIVLLESPQVRAPVAVGVFRQVVLVPNALLEQLTAEERRDIALHEMAHVKRRDPFVFSLVAFVRTLLYFHPIIWLAIRQVCTLAEQAADDVVLGATGKPLRYAKLLSRLAEELPRCPSPPEFVAGVMLSKGAFVRRVEAILSDRRHEIRRLTRYALAGTVGAGVLCLGIALALPLADKNDDPELDVEGQLRYEVTLESHNEIVVGGQAVFRCRLFNVGAEEVTLYWGDYPYKDQYRMSVARSDGTELLTSGRFLMPDPARLNPKYLKRIAPGEALDYNVILSSHDLQRYFFRHPGEYLIRPSFSTWAIPEPHVRAGDTGSPVLTKPLDAEPITLRVTMSDRRVLPGWVRIEGRVVGPSGTAVSNGQVALERYFGTPLPWPSCGGAAMAYHPLPTDDTGRFASGLQHDDHWSEIHMKGVVTDSGGEPVAGAQIVVTAYDVAPSVRTQGEPVFLEEANTDETGRFILERLHRNEQLPQGIAIAGELVDAQGAAVPNAHMLLHRHIIAGGGTGDRKSETAATDIQRTDEGGRFAFTHLPSDSSFFVLVSNHPPYAKAKVCVVMRPPATRYDVRLELSSQEDGVASILVTPNAPGAMPAQTEEPVGNVPNASEADLDFSDPASGWVAGRVVYEDGTPALGTAVLRDFSRGPLLPEGRFQVRLRGGSNAVRLDLCETTCWPRVPGDGAQPRLQYVQQTPDTMLMGASLVAWVPVDVDPGQLVTLPDVVLNRSSLSIMRVQCDRDLFPVSGTESHATLIVATGTCLLAYDFPFVLSKDPRDPIYCPDDNGFVVKDIPAGEKVLVLSGGNFLWYTVVVPGGPREEVDVGPVDVETLSGHVYDASGSPVEGACVIVRCPRFQALSAGVRAFHGLSGGTWVKTGAHGAFTLRLGPGQYRLKVKGEGEDCAILVDVKAEDNADVILRLEGP